MSEYAINQTINKVLELPSQDELRRMFDYDTETGDLIWKKREDRDICWNGHFAGKRAGSNNKGYRYVQIDNKKYAAHRIIWKLAYGNIPTHLQIDHIDGNGMNNRLDNLRLATNQQNQLNRMADNIRKGEIKYKGVYKHNNRYKAEITTSEGRKYLWLFKTPELAAIAYNKAAKEYHGKHACLNEVQQ